MATQTTYYEFNKPSGTDLVNPLVDTNPNWDIADAGLHELDERSIANATETVVLGVHAISVLNENTKFLKWIATANFTTGDTFTVNGDAVAATTPAGATLATGAYVTGAVVLACLNADNTAMTIFVSGTNVATDSERLGGELPSYYATDSDMDNAQTDISNIKALLGNTSIAGIDDGTVTGAIDLFNTTLSNKADKSYVTANEIESVIPLASNMYDFSNPYIPADDGYISVSNATVFVYGASATSLSTNTNRVWIANNSGQISEGLFVRKGMQIVVSTGTAYFTPLS